MKTRERRHTNDIQNKSLVSFLIVSTANSIGDTGATSLSESLKSNTTLVELNLSGKDLKK